MPRKRDDPPRGGPTISPAKGIDLIKRQIEAAKALTNQTIDSAVYTSWKNTTKSCLEKAFGENSPKVIEFVQFGSATSIPMNASEQWWSNRRAQNIQGRIVLLNGLIDLLRIEIELSEPGSPANSAADHSKSRKVFVVHGHDEALRQAVARFLEKLELEPILLDERPNEGRTVLQKFSDHSDVAFAVVILTPDDFGGKAGTATDKPNKRARQNVVFEFGYFLGKLGAASVCAIYHPEVELPSDLTGIAYVPAQGDGWKMRLGQELKTAGLEIDMNKVF
jgi:predicted nucleotide-binding protein